MFDKSDYNELKKRLAELEKELNLYMEKEELLRKGTA